MENNTNLEHKRHTLAHLLAASVQDLYPDVKLTLGPAIETGFYYDMDFSEPISDKDLVKIEKRMKKKISQWNSFEHREVSPKEAREIYKDNPYKLELVNDIVERGEKITLYTIQGFTDLCRGGHSQNPAKEIKPNTFTLDKIAGAYWRGDENNPMLTRIYGFAFETAEELESHLEMIEEAKKRDHRRIGKEMNLFTFSDLVGPGLPLFTPKGTLIRDLIIDKIMAIQKAYGYQKVTIPHITKPDLYKTSGHWDKFGDELFKVTGKSGGEFVMKPMNCPHHTQIFASQMRSYKDLPQRYMEEGVVYRDEQAGELIGLSRVRAITQDDGHVFCTSDQIKEEIGIIIQVIKEFYTSLNMFSDNNYWVSLSVRDPETPEKYLGEDALWEQAENYLEEIAKEHNLNYKRVEGEAAFYGPKLDFQFFDALGRERQLATAQLDFNMPKRFELEYVDENGDKKTPVMIHRAVAGSLERFMAIMIEHFAGWFPFWLSPVQVAVLPVNKDAHGEYGEEILAELLKNDIRAEIWTEDSLGKRIRRGKTEKIPYLFVLGDSEMEGRTITAEAQADVKHESITLDEFLKIANN